MDAIVAHYPTPEERYHAASAIRHEIARRQRRATRTASFLKVCPSCSTAKSHDSYRRCSTRPDGLDWQCRSCAVAGRRTPS